MDSKKPGSEPAKKGPDAKSRPAPGATGTGPGTGGRDRTRPVLTERQRAEARRQRRQGRRRRSEVKASEARGNVLSRGMRATGTEVQRTFLFLGRSILSGLDFLRPVGGIAVRALLAAADFIGSALRLLAHGLGRIIHAFGQACLALDRLITTQRAVAFVAFVAAGLLVASQFIDYRATEIGQPGYIVVESITHAPQVEQLTPVDNHSLLLVVAGLAALAASGLSLLSSRRLLSSRLLSSRRLAGTVMAAAGGLTIVVALAIDLPRALDITDAQLSYSGVKAVLLSGFWLELGAGAVLAVTGLATLLGPQSARTPARGHARTRRTPVGSQA